MTSIPNNLSRSFTHFYQKLGTGKNRTLKSLRKNYLTRLKLYWSNIRHISGHSTERILDEYYLDQEQLAIAMRDFEVFPKMEKDRPKELDNIRNKSIQKENKLEK